MTVFVEYLSMIRKEHGAGDATEHTHRPALKSLLESAAKGITATNEPKRILCGSPDFQVVRKGVPLGHVETKDIGTNLDEMERGKGPHGEQFTRYRDGLPNWLLTDYLQFRWFVGGERRVTVRIAKLDANGKLKPLPDGERELAELLTAFFQQPALTVASARELAQRMAGMTRIIRDLIINTFDREQEEGWLHAWLNAFRETLIPDIEEEQFADMFAQTLAYGLFAARVHAPPNKPFSRELAAYNLPRTNPFLRKLFAEIAGVDMPDSIAWAVDDIVELLKHADMAEILTDFGKGQGKEDPVVHFYETFLAAYDLKMREVRGVYYTPEPVVSYIVRSIDHLLRTRFNRPKGLADENTLILDPATGTATFLYFVIEQMRRKFATQAGAWDDYVAKHLLNRVFGFELLMAPYAVAHLKLGMQLQETGYHFGSDQRLGIYLTNTLEEAAKKSEHLFAGWVADEANAAYSVKTVCPIMVVMGNPPYSGLSANMNEWINNLLKKRLPLPNGAPSFYQCDGKPLGEKKLWLQDDYVKFIRFAQYRIEKTGYGILGFITNHSYLDNPTFRGMRQSLMATFDDIYILDLHGNAKKKETSPDGSKDENVFDIMQGVAIALFIKRENGPTKQPAKVCHAELWGTRGLKYEWLFGHDIQAHKWNPLKPNSPQYFFVPRDESRRSEYEQWPSITRVFPQNVTGIVTARDDFVIDFDATPLLARIATLRDRQRSDSDIRAEFFGERTSGKYPPGDSRGWKLPEARKRVEQDNDWRTRITNILYRPFDVRRIYYAPWIVDWPRLDMMPHMLAGDNLGMTIGRAGQVIGSESWDIVHCTDAMSDLNFFRRGGNSLLPLYLYPSTEAGADKLFAEGPGPGKGGRRPNLSPQFVAECGEKLGLAFVPDGAGDLKKTFGPEDVFHCSYAVFHSPTYRSRYAEFLKIDFPRLPLTSDLGLFRALAAKGAELVALHLLRSPKIEELVTDWPVKGDNVVEKVRYTEKEGRVWINKTQYFGGVPKAVWEFHIGGYQVCYKWLKDRKGRKLTYEDTQHYQKVVVALDETVRLMGGIDEVIGQHGGWPMR